MEQESNKKLKIVKLVAENVKKIKAIEINPDGNTVVISGANAQGKSSVLDSIWLALGGRDATKEISEPIRRGEKDAITTLDLGEYVITRTWNAKGTNLKITNHEGATFSSPQVMLDNMIGKLSFDPLAFTQMPPKEQVKVLLGLIQLPIDLDALDTDRKELFEFRTSINRDVKALEGRRNAIPYYPEVPTKEISTSDILYEYQQATQKIADNDLTKVRLSDTTTERDNLIGVRQRLIDELAVCEKDLSTVSNKVVEVAKEVEALVYPDVEAIKGKIETVEQDNIQIRTQKDRLKINAELAEEQGRSKELTEKITDIDELKAKTIEESNMPVDGLGFDESGITYQGMALSQCSSAEQLRVSIAIAMALNPTVRVIRITDGSLLDSQNMKMIEDMANDNDFQIWIEVVDESGKLGIVIEDGMVKE